MARLHPNVLKDRKQRRAKGRRAYLTSVYNLIKVPRSISTSDIPEDAQPLFNYRKRGSVTGFDPFLDAMFPGVKQESQQRKWTLEQAEAERVAALVADQDVCDYVTLQELHIQKKRITFVFNRSYTRCFFIEVCYEADETGSYVMKSKIYGSKERAMFDFEHKRVSWMEFLPLSTLTLVLPRRA